MGYQCLFGMMVLLCQQFCNHNEIKIDWVDISMSKSESLNFEICVAVVFTRSSSNREHLFNTFSTAATVLDWYGATAHAEPGHPPGARRCTRRLSKAQRRPARCSWRKEPTGRPPTKPGKSPATCSSAIQTQCCRPSLALASTLACRVGSGP